MPLSTPTLPEMLASAEANVARTIKPADLSRLEKRLDTSDEHYFLVLMECALQFDPVRYRQPVQPPLGDHWRSHIGQSRLDALLPYLNDMRQVAAYSERDRRRIFRAAATPQRFKHNFQYCVRFARQAIDIVGNPEFGNLHAFFERLVRVDGGWEQPVLRAALLESFGSHVSWQFIGKAGLSRSVQPAGVRILQRLSIVSSDGNLRIPSESEEQQAAVFYHDVATATGHPFSYVESIFAANYAHSRLDAMRWNLSFQGAAVCFGDGPKCSICSHVAYCPKLGAEEPVRDRDYGWLSLYPQLRAQLVAGCSTIGNLPDVAAEAVLLCLRWENSFAWRSPLPVPVRDDLGCIRASLVHLTADTLRDVWQGWASETFPEGRSLGDCAAEIWPVGDLADNQVPCLLNMPAWPPFAGEGDALLAEYLGRGCTTVPVLAIDWGHLGDVVSEQKSRAAVP